MSMTFELLTSKAKVQLSHLVEYWIDNITYWQSVAKHGEYWPSESTSISPVSCNERIQFSKDKIAELTGY